MTKLAVILIKGLINTNSEVKNTLNSLSLKNKLNCKIVEDSPENRHLFRKLNSFVTWGEVDDASVKLIQGKRKVGTAFALHPPIGGFERKGTKRDFRLKGALGYRSSEINKLIARMV